MLSNLTSPLVCLCASWEVLCCVLFDESYSSLLKRSIPRRLAKIATSFDDRFRLFQCFEANGRDIEDVLDVARGLDPDRFGLGIDA